MMQKLRSTVTLASHILQGNPRITKLDDPIDINVNFGKSTKDFGNSLVDYSWEDATNKRRYGFWKDKENQRIFLNKVAKELNIRVPMEWGKVKRTLLYEHGIVPILQEYGGSFQRALFTLFPSVAWKEEWFVKKRGYWSSEFNQRKFFDKIANLLHVKSPREWGNIPVRNVIKLGGARIIESNGGSMIRALKKAYPGVIWQEDWFIHKRKYSYHHWSSLDNQLQFMNDLKSEYQIYNHKDWKRITSQLICKRGGQGLLAEYDYSLSLLINSIYGNATLDQSKSIDESNLRLCLQKQLN